MIPGPSLRPLSHRAASRRLSISSLAIVRSRHFWGRPQRRLFGPYARRPQWRQSEPWRRGAEPRAHQGGRQHHCSYRNFANAAAGTIGIDIDGLSANQFGRLTSSGTATPAGTLNVSLVNGFSPAIGNSFRILTFPARAGQFDTINGLQIGRGKQFSPTYGGTNLTVSR